MTIGICKARYDTTLFRTTSKNLDECLRHRRIRWVENSSSESVDANDTRDDDVFVTPARLILGCRGRTRTVTAGLDSAEE